eukprot:scaffold318_cov396-Prasinococcus_capsulatus_cf.AAC.8
MIARKKPQAGPARTCARWSRATAYPSLCRPATTTPSVTARKIFRISREPLSGDSRTKWSAKNV